MEYQPVGNAVFTTDSTEGDDTAYLTKEEHTGPQITDHSYLPPSFLLCYCFISTTIIIIIVGSLGFNSSRFVSSSCPMKLPNTKTFGRDFRFMSADRVYDNVWKDWAFKEEGNDEEHEAPISAGIGTMFHQLHCLAAFRHAIQLGHEGIDPGLDFMDDAHWPHCFDYMRKSILCWADDTHETTPRISNRTRMWTLDGSLDMRQCKDNTKLVQMANNLGKNPFP